MSEGFDKLKADVVKLEGVAQSTADNLVTALKGIADLKAQLAAGSTDTQGMADLAASVEGTLANIAGELPAPTPTEPPVTDPNAPPAS